MPREEQRPEVPAHGPRGSSSPVFEAPQVLCLQLTAPKQWARLASFPCPAPPGVRLAGRRPGGA